MVNDTNVYSKKWYLKRNKFSGIKPFKNIEKNKLVKLIGIGIIALLAIIIIILISVAIFGNNGEKIASKLGEKCGKSISSAEKNADIPINTANRMNCQLAPASKKNHTPIILNDLWLWSLFLTMALYEIKR